MWIKPCGCGQEPADADKSLRMSIKALRLRLRILLGSLKEGSTDSLCLWAASYRERKFCAKNLNLDHRSSRMLLSVVWLLDIDVSG
jgi:hypothetical protein